MGARQNLREIPPRHRLPIFSRHRTPCLGNQRHPKTARRPARTARQPKSAENRSAKNRTARKTDLPQKAPRQPPRQNRHEAAWHLDNLGKALHGGIGKKTMIKFSTAIANRVARYVADGRSFFTLQRFHGMPNSKELRYWLLTNSNF